MYILDIGSTCSNPLLIPILSMVKKGMLLIQIIVPILLIISASISFFQLMANPEKKGGTKIIINKFIAAAIVFFIPFLVNMVMGLVGENTSISSCWNSVGSSNTGGDSSYVDSNTNDGRTRSKIGQ